MSPPNTSPSCMATLSGMPAASAAANSELRTTLDFMSMRGSSSASAVVGGRACPSEPGAMVATAPTTPEMARIAMTAARASVGLRMDRLESLVIQKPRNPRESSKDRAGRKSTMSPVQQDIQTLRRGSEELIVEEELARKLPSGRKRRVKLGPDPPAPDRHPGPTGAINKLRPFQERGKQ